MKKNALALALAVIAGIGFVNAFPLNDEPVKDTVDQTTPMAMVDTTETESFLVMIDTTETESFLAMDTTEKESVLVWMDEPVKDTTDTEETTPVSVLALR